MADYAGDDCKKQEMYDPLTGIYNCQAFYHYTAELLKENPAMQFCLIYWNIRKFKVVNDLFGRDNGDKVLIRLAQSIRELGHDEKATYGRVERDNFVCCVTDEVIRRGEWLKLADVTYDIAGSEYRFFCCLGIYKISNPTMKVSNMVDRARVAMEKVKENYLKPYAWFDESMWGAIVEEQRLNSEFKTAIAGKQFQVYYQPICRTSDGEVVGMEALVRWQHPERGLISPGMFIPLFEKNGFISILDRYVWNEVCSMQRNRLDRKIEVVPISINVSRVEFYNQHLCEDIYSIVKKYDLPTEIIKIEITESAYSDNPEMVREAVKKMHEMGFIVLMDDFGSGYSSLNILKDLPVDVLKIDMKFMDDIENNQSASIILEAIIRMAKWMKLETVAEGVETKKNWDYLRSIECDLVQGYYFYKPMPEQQVAKLFDRKAEAPAARREEGLELEDVIMDVFGRSNSRESLLFYSMLGGMGILEMTQDSLEIIQVNKGYYEAVYGDSQKQNAEVRVLNKLVEEPDLSILMEKCRLSKEEDRVEQVQIRHKREDDIFVWLNIKVRYLGSRGKRSLFYFALDNIDEIKKIEQERYLIDYSEALLRVFDKVYRLDYNTGLAEVLHTCGTDHMQIGQKYNFVDFFDRFSDGIEWGKGKNPTAIIKNKNLLDQELEKSPNGSFAVNYRIAKSESDIIGVSALFFKVQMPKGSCEYICCIKRQMKKE